LDDVQKQSLTFIDNDTRTLTDVRLGAQGVDAGTNGTIYFDDFESRRFSYIGTLTDPGVDDPQATNQAGWFTRTYTYSASIPHAVTSVNPETGSPDTYSYDANGNMTCRIENGVTYTHTYNAENRASSIAKRSGDCATGTILESWSFAYDGDGTRVTTAHFTGTNGTPDSTTSYFMGGQYEVKDGATKKYYSIAGMMVAVNDGTGLQYLLTDHLGSTVAITNASGTLTNQQRYLPFGGTRPIPNSPITITDYGYTGQRLLDEDMGGIMDYKARFYSPALMRFLQPDSIIPDQANPQSWNRFSYANNNPVNYNDPSGHCSVAIVQTFVPGTGWVVYVPQIVCPSDNDDEPGADIVWDGGDTEPAHDFISQWDPPEWGPDVISFGSIVDRNNNDMPSNNDSLASMAKGVSKPNGLKPGSTKGNKTGYGFPDSVRNQHLQDEPTQTCVYCGREGNGTQLDHIIPRARGGDDTLENAQWTCPHCNQSKGSGSFPKTPPPEYEGPWPRWWKTPR
jgi:RHS repeat-associated protein